MPTRGIAKYGDFGARLRLHSLRSGSVKCSKEARAKHLQFLKSSTFKHAYYHFSFLLRKQKVGNKGTEMEGVKKMRK